MEVINQKQSLPNASATLILGILSIVLGCGILGLVLGIIGLVISKDGKDLYMHNPDAYSGYGNLNAGRIMSIIGIVIGGITIIWVIFWIAVGGAILGSLIGMGSSM
jgi:CO dehydrogenase/acetyl-CoA synthase alpha subunit